MLSGLIRDDFCMMLRAGGFCGIATILLLVTATSAVAAPGDLDPRFSTDGRLITDFAGGDDFVDEVAVIPDGRVLAAGATTPPGDHSSDVAVARYLSDGSIDSAFGDGGQRVITFPVSAAASGLAVGPSAETVIATPGGPGPGDQLTVIRLREDGSFDPSFSEDGVLSTLVEGRNAVARDVTVDPLGRITIVGQVHEDGVSESITIARFLADGTPDPAFSGDGSLRVTQLSAETAETVEALPDGGFIVSGLAADERYSYDHPVVHLVGLTASGDLDVTFGNNGIVSTGIRGTPGETETAVGPRGEIYIGQGVTDCISGDGCYFSSELHRFEPDGSFSANLRSGAHPAAVGGLAMDDAGRLLVGLGGRCRSAEPASAGCVMSDLFAARVVGDRVDGGFAASGAGHARVDFDRRAETGGAIAAANDGVILAGSSTTAAGDSDFAITRLQLADGPPDADADGVLDDVDACDLGFAPATLDGCPHLPSRIRSRARDHRLFGRVTSAEALCSESREVALFPARANRPTQTAVAGDDGRFVFRRIDPGQYALRALEHVSPYGLCTQVSRAGVRIP